MKRSGLLISLLQCRCYSIRRHTRAGEEGFGGGLPNPLSVLCVAVLSRLFPLPARQKLVSIRSNTPCCPDGCYATAEKVTGDTRRGRRVRFSSVSGNRDDARTLITATNPLNDELKTARSHSMLLRPAATDRVCFFFTRTEQNKDVLSVAGRQFHEFGCGYIIYCLCGKLLPFSQKVQLHWQLQRP